jgi:hypothetical protein
MTQLLTAIFNHDFASCADNDAFKAHFFARPLAMPELKLLCEHVCASHIELGGQAIPAAIHIKGTKPGAPFAILAQLHGNEPAGLAGIALAMALAQAGKLERDVIGVIGNPLAAKQYFTAWEQDPHARQETRDAYRCGLSEDGALLADMNRIPVDFLTRPAADHHTRRARELYALGQHINGIADIHSARGNMTCITDHKHDRDLKNSPIRSLLTGLAEAISANAAGSVTVQTLKTILSPLPHILSQTGIEAGRHESPQAPLVAASFTLSLLHTLGITAVTPLYTDDGGAFERYAVQPRITYADLDYTASSLRADDRIYMATPCHALASVPERSHSVIVRQPGGAYALQSVAAFTENPGGSMEYALYQYDEMEAIPSSHTVAVALPSGTAFKTREAFSGIFVSKAAELYDKDPAVGPWPVAAERLADVKFCYPCYVSPMTLEF